MAKRDVINKIGKLAIVNEQLDDSVLEVILELRSKLV